MTEPHESHAGCSQCCSRSKRSSESGATRRDFLLIFGLGLNVVAGALMGIPVLGYILSWFRRDDELKPVSLGPISKFPEGQTVLASYVNPIKRPWDGMTADIPCWVRRLQGEQFQVFAINCTHLGCPVRWFKESKLFLCPCHGGAFYEDGSHAAGPPPRGLYSYQSYVEKGELVILAGRLPTLAQPFVQEEKV